jgi:hypothetical protein
VRDRLFRHAHYLYLLRVPILFCVLLLVLVAVAVPKDGAAASLLRGTFDIAPSGASPWIQYVSFLACVMSAASAAFAIYMTAYLVLRYSHQRAKAAKIPDPALDNADLLLILLSILPAVALVVGAWAVTDVPWYVALGAVVSGVAISTGLVYVVHVWNPSGFPLRWLAARLRHSPAGFLGPKGDFLDGHRLALFYLFFSLALYAGVGIVKGFYLEERIVFSTLTMLLLWAALACWASGFVAFYFDRYRIPFLIPLILYLGAGSFSRENDHFFPSQEAEPPEQVTPGIVLEKGGHDTVILIAATGGGIQSASWTGNVLARLKETFGDVPQFDRSVRLVSSVSGGSVGAMYFLHAYQNGVLPSGREELRSRIVEAAQASSLDAVIWGWLFQDQLRAFIPFGWEAMGLLENDRGLSLQRAWSERVKGIEDATLSSWRRDAAAGLRPAVIFNTTVVETGQRLLLSTTDLRKREKGCAPRAAALSASVGFYDLYPCSDITVPTAARLSATFPVVTPAARIEQGGTCERHNHVIDGGYYDNYGMSSLLEWLDIGLQQTSAIRNVIVLEIRSSPAAEVSPAEGKYGWFFQTGSALTTMAKVREDAQLANNNRMLCMAKRLWASKAVTIASFPVVYRPGEEGTKPPTPPLSWHLTAEQTTNIERAATRAAEGVIRDVRNCFTNPEKCEELARKYGDACRN